METTAVLTPGDIERLTGGRGISEATIARGILDLVRVLSAGAAASSCLGSAAIRVLASRRTIAAPLLIAGKELASACGRAIPPGHLSGGRLGDGFAVGCAVAVFDEGPEAVFRFLAEESEESSPDVRSVDQLAYGVGMVLGYSSARRLTVRHRQTYRRWMLQRVKEDGGGAIRPGRTPVEQSLRRYAAVFRCVLACS